MQLLNPQVVGRGGRRFKSQTDGWVPSQVLRGTYISPGGTLSVFCLRTAVLALQTSVGQETARSAAQSGPKCCSGVRLIFTDLRTLGLREKCKYPAMCLPVQPGLHFVIQNKLFS